MNKAEQTVRASIVRRACDHVSLRDIHEYDRERYANAMVGQVREMNAPNWQQVLQLANLVRTRYDATEASVQDECDDRAMDELFPD